MRRFQMVRAGNKLEGEGEKGLVLAWALSAGTGTLGWAVRQGLS